MKKQPHVVCEGNPVTCYSWRARPTRSEAELIAMPIVSVIIPCYNGSAFIGATIESVQAQTFQEWELVVVDDGSTDGSAEVVTRYAEADHRVRLVRQPNGGVARARNAGFAAASPESEYLLFLDADDLLVPEMLERLVGYLEENKGVGLVHCDSLLIDKDGRLREERWVGRFAPSPWGGRVLPADHVVTPFVSIYLLAPLIPSLCLIRRSAYEQTPGWDEAIGQPCEDTDLFLHVALRSTVHYVPQGLVYYRVHSAQSTHSEQRLTDQRRKLYAKWGEYVNLTDSDRAVVREAERFRRGRFIGYFGILGARRQLAERNYGRAARILGGALIRMLRQQVLRTVQGDGYWR